MDPLTTRPIQTGCESALEPYASGQFGFIDDLDYQFGRDSVWTRTRTRSDGLEPLLTLAFNLGQNADAVVHEHGALDDDVDTTQKLQLWQKRGPIGALHNICK